MNRIYRVIFDRRLGRACVASELARSTHSTSSARNAVRRGGASFTVALASLLASAGGDAWAACTPASPVDGDVVSCTGVPILLPPNPNSFLSNANNLNVTVQAGAIMSTLPGGTAMTLGGTGLTLDNLGAIDANAAGSLVTSRALAIGDLLTPTNSNVTLNNQGTIEGTFDGTFGLAGAAMLLSTSGIVSIQNAGTIGMAALGMFDPINAIGVGVYGGANVSFINTGIITGRIAFQTPDTGGNSFVNAGTLNGSVSLGTTVANDSFTAVTGSSLSGGLVPLPGVTVPTPEVPASFLTFAGGGTVDAGIGGVDTLVLQNQIAGPGSGSGGSGTAAAAQYLNFENLTVNSGTWTLNGAVVSNSTTLNGGTAVFDNALAFGTGTLTANGGAIQPSVAGLTLSQGVDLAAGLIVQGANSLTLAGAVTGGGGLIKNGSGTLTLTGDNDFSGGLALNGGGLTLGQANSLGTGPFLVGGPATLNTAFTGTLANPVLLNGALALNGLGTLAFAGTVAGGGSLTLNSGALSLIGNNGYSGGTVLNGGSVSLGTSSALGTGALTVNGPVAMNGASGVTLTNPVVLNDTLGLGAGGGALGFNGPITGAGGLTIAPGPAITLNGANDFSGGVNLAGGTLVVGNDAALGTGAVTVSGAGSLASNTAVNLGNNFHLNATLSAGGSSDLALGGTLGGLAGIVKTGTGTLTLTGTNAYSGPTTVSAGTLQVNNVSGSGTGSSAVTVQSGARLAGSGRVGGDVAIASGGRLAPGSAPSAMGTLTISGNLSLAGGSRLDYQFGAPGPDFLTAGQGDSLSVGGDLSIGAGALVDVSDAGGFGPGVYRLIDYAGTLAPGSALALGSVPAGASLSIQNLSADKRFMLVNTTGMTLNFWNANGLASPVQSGGGSGTWSTTSPVWTDLAGSVSAPMSPQPGFAVFSGAPGTVTVDASAGAVQATGLQFAVGGYTLAGDALTLTGAGGGARAEVRVGDGSAASAGFSATLGNIIAGSAGLAKTGAGTLVLGGVNTYSGGTAVQAGTLSVSADANLGAAGGGLWLDGGRLQVTGTGFTATARGIEVAAAGGEIAIADAGLELDASGALGGSGALLKSGAGTLRLSGASSYTGATTIAAGTLRMGAAGVLGAGARVTLADHAGATLDLDGFDQTIGSLAGGGSAGGALRLGSATLTTGGDNGSTRFAGTVEGAGSLVKQGSGHFTLAGAATHTGTTQVAAGTLSAGAANVLSAASAHSVAAGATLDLAGFSQTVGALANSGTVSLAGSTPGTTLTVRGAYTGHGGVLRLGTLLGADGPSDRLVLDGAGASASGRTTLQIVNLGGLGALTSGNGIEVISARNGATTTAQTTKDAFALAGGHVDAGAYEYRLHAADANGAGESWYLRSTLPGSGDGPALPTPLYRVEVPLHAALAQQLRQGNLAMLGSLALRGGEDPVRAPSNDAGERTEDPGARLRRAWGRVISTDVDVAQRGTVGARSDGRLHGFQAGTDLWAGTRWRAGVYVGQLEGDVQVHGDARGLLGLHVGGNDLRSRYLGAYATWRGDGGWYADAVLQAGQHRYSVQPLAALGSSGKGKSLLASVEVGKAFDLGGGWRVEPQLQLIHQQLDLDRTAIAGAWVAQSPDDGLVVRAGVRVQGEIATGAGRLQPYGRLNVFHAPGGADVAQFLSLGGSTAIWSETGSTSTELAGGMTLSVGDRTSVYAELGKLWASGGGARVKSSLNASVGVRVRW